MSVTSASRSVMGVEGLDVLVAALRARGYRVVGPVVREGVIVYDDLASAEDLPIGWTEVQEAATYRLERRGDEARFGYPVGPHSWKRFLFPSQIRLWRARLHEGSIQVDEEPAPDRTLAFVGVRPCDLRAIETQDRVFLGGMFVESDYAARREGAFVVAVDCGVPGGTCFCVSMDTGPAARGGFDLRLTEILDGGHRFLVESGSEAGGEVLAELPTTPARPADVAAAEQVTANAARQMGRSLEADGLRDLLERSREHPRWAEVAERCLSCGNCTLVCPTCFCTEVDEVNVLGTERIAERWRRWDSCYSVDYSYIHGGSVRPSARARYRQWLTHKFGTWFDQFGTSGCVGCGRCITWCPVGIDVTEELAAIRLGDGEGPDALA